MKKVFSTFKKKKLERHENKKIIAKTEKTKTDPKAAVCPGMDHSCREKEGVRDC